MEYFDDELIIKNICSENPTQDLLQCFFKDVRNYAKNYWITKYPRLQPNDWDDILSQVDFVFIKRIKNGLSLHKSKLASYYTLITKYAILDHINKNKTRNETEIDDISYTLGEPPKFEINIDNIQKSDFLRNKFEEYVKNGEQLKATLLFFEGFSYREILQMTNYKSETACRNAVVKCKKKIKDVLQHNNKELSLLKSMLN